MWSFTTTSHLWVGDISGPATKTPEPDEQRSRPARGKCSEQGHKNYWPNRRTFLNQRTKCSETVEENAQNTHIHLSTHKYGNPVKKCVHRQKFRYASYDGECSMTTQPLREVLLMSSLHERAFPHETRHLLHCHSNTHLYTQHNTVCTIWRADEMTASFEVQMFDIKLTQNITAGLILLRSRKYLQVVMCVKSSGKEMPFQFIVWQQFPCLLSSVVRLKTIEFSFTGSDQAHGQESSVSLEQPRGGLFCRVNASRLLSSLCWHQNGAFIHGFS